MKNVSLNVWKDEEETDAHGYIGECDTDYGNRRRSDDMLGLYHGLSKVVCQGHDAEAKDNASKTSTHTRQAVWKPRSRLVVSCFRLYKSLSDSIASDDDKGRGQD